jgi:hypothetical protein
VLGRAVLLPLDRRARRGVGIHGTHRQTRCRPVEEEDTWVSGEEVGRREDPPVDEQVQAPAHPVGGEEKELRRNATLRLLMDYVAGGGAAREVIIRTRSKLHRWWPVAQFE